MPCGDLLLAISRSHGRRHEQALGKTVRRTRESRPSRLTIKATDRRFLYLINFFIDGNPLPPD